MRFVEQNTAIRVENTWHIDSHVTFDLFRVESLLKMNGRTRVVFGPNSYVEVPRNQYEPLRNMLMGLKK